MSFEYITDIYKNLCRKVCVSVNINFAYFVDIAITRSIDSATIVLLLSVPFKI